MDDHYPKSRGRKMDDFGPDLVCSYTNLLIRRQGIRNPFLVRHPSGGKTVFESSIPDWDYSLPIVIFRNEKTGEEWARRCIEQEGGPL
jgi:hypothetical protein